MRTTLLFTSAIAILISSCSTGNKMESSANKGDDLYVTQTETAPPSLTDESTDPSGEEYQNDQTNPSPDYTTSDKYTDENGTTYITNNYYEGQNYDFYGSDYNSYSSDLSRWYGPSLGFGYYSPFYTSPGFGISLSFGFGWGNSWYNPYYPYYNPYYSWYSPYYSYNPWYSPYYYGYYPYYNPYYGGGYCGGGYYGGGYYGDGYGYYGDTYYGSHGSSSGNTGGNGDGRKYKYGEDVSGDQNSGINSNNNIPVLAKTPRTSIVINGNEANGADIKTPVIGGENEIKRKPAIENGNSSNNGVETIKSNPGRNLSTPDNQAEIKSDIPPRSASPSNQNMQNDRPRTIAQAPLFEQQRNSNTVANAINKQMSSDNQEYAQVEPKTRVAPDMSDVKNEKALVISPSHSNPGYKISKPQSEKHTAFSKEQSKKSLQSRTNVNNDRPSNNNSNAGTRSYNQSNNAHSSSSGNVRSSNNSPRK